jgi:AI-2 transport protein TqsA
MRGAPFLNFVLAVALALMVGWLLIMGSSLLLPVITAVISVYVLTEASKWLGRMPPTRNLSAIWRMALLLGLFSLVAIALGLVVATTVNEIIAAGPRYQANLEAMAGRISERFSIELPASWDDAMDLLFDAFDFQAMMILLLGWMTRIGIVTFLILVYVGFILAEWDTFGPKLRLAFPDRARSDQLGAIIVAINGQIGHYLALKTFVNVVLGILSYSVLWWFGVDFALFWAIVIALTNYIPYVGGFVGVAFPVALSLAQFESLSESLMLTVFLTLAQIAVGNFLDPWLMGRQLNLSRLVILLSLTLWTMIWGIPGAILAIPMTSMLTIIFASFASTRFIAILLSETGDPVSPQLDNDTSVITASQPANPSDDGVRPSSRSSRVPAGGSSDVG